jgi:acetyl-CoA acetyltransferase
MRRVFVVGGGIIKFGKFPERGIRKMAEEVLFNLFKDAGAKPSDVEAAYVGSQNTACDDTLMMVGQIALEQAGIVGIPITNCTNACGSGSNAVHQAWLAIQSGLYDVTLALGIEKMSSPLLPQAMMAGRLGGGDSEIEGVFGLFAPGIFGMIAKRHMEEYGTTREQMAKVAVKNRFHASLNPTAQYQTPTTIEEVLSSRVVADPLTVLECSPISDGAAAVLLASEDAVKRFSGKPVEIIASVQVSGTYSFTDILNIDTTRRAAKKAYEMAGVGPEDIDLAEVHDCFSIAEIIHYEELGFCKKGEGGRFIDSGAPFLGGKKPVNTSGGLIAKGHPLGATGVAQIVEILYQLRGQAGKRQVPNARIGLTHNGGGFRKADTGIVCVHILKKV